MNRPEGRAYIEVTAEQRRAACNLMHEVGAALNRPDAEDATPIERAAGMLERGPLPVLVGLGMLPLRVALVPAAMAAEAAAGGEDARRAAAVAAHLAECENTVVKWVRSYALDHASEPVDADRVMFRTMLVELGIVAQSITNGTATSGLPPGCHAVKGSTLSAWVSCLEAIPGAAGKAVAADIREHMTDRRRALS